MFKSVGMGRDAENTDAYFVILLPDEVIVLWAEIVALSAANSSIQSRTCQHQNA